MKPLLLFLCLCLLIPIIQAQDSTCTPALSFDYDANADIFSLVNTDGAVIQTYSNIRAYDDLGTSPDCRFIVASLWRDYQGSERPDLSIAGDTTVWNASTGEQLQVFEDAHESPHLLWWSPDSERLIVGTRHGHFLWNFYTDAQTQVSEYGVGQWWIQVHWDSNRTELFVMSHTYYHSNDELLVFNWLTGTQIATYNFAPERFRPYNEASFRVMDNYVLLYRLGSSQEFLAPVAVWERSSHQMLYLVNAQKAGPQGSNWGWNDTNYSAQRIDLSPDGRYLVIAYSTLRVWDLWNLAPDFEDRTPLYIHPVSDSGADRVRFLDNSTVEMLIGESLIRMNILTGEILE